jgi:hypothetical protein
MEEKKLVRIIIIQFIIVLILIFLNVFLIMDFDQNNGNNDDTYKLISNEVTGNLSININWSVTSANMNSRRAEPRVTVTNNNQDIIIGRDTNLLELILKDLNGTKLDDSSRYQDYTLFPNERGLNTFSIDIPGNWDYMPGYSIEVYAFYNGELFYTTSKTFPARKI